MNVTNVLAPVGDHVAPGEQFWSGIPEYELLGRCTKTRKKITDNRK